MLALLFALLVAFTPFVSSRSYAASTSLDAILRAMEELRGLKAQGPAHKEPFKRETTNRTKLERYLKARFDEEYSDAELQLEGNFLKRLGLLPEAIDYKKTVLDFIMGELGGYYDPERRTLYSADWIPVSLQETVMAHEMTHALQDANFDLKPFLKRDRDNDDATLAWQSLIEGDATIAMYMYTLKHEGATAEESLLLFKTALEPSLTQMSIDDYIAANVKSAAVPRFIQQMTYFPYVEGAKFTIAMLQGSRDSKNSTWDLIDNAYQQTPRSSSEILHPEKYKRRLLAKEKPPTLPELGYGIELLLQPNWKVREQNVMGEFVCRILLRSDSACDGWLQDRYALMTDAEDHLMAFWLSNWESTKDAKEFSAALKQYTEATASLKAQPYCVITKDKAVAFVTGTNRCERLLPADYRKRYQIP